MNTNYLIIYNTFWENISTNKRMLFAKQVKVYFRKNSNLPDKRRFEYKVLIKYKPDNCILGGEVKVE